MSKVNRVFRRVWKHEDEGMGISEIQTAKVALKLTDISTYEEYTYETLSDYGKPLTTLVMYTGDVIIIDCDFDTFHKEKEAADRGQGLNFNNN